MAKTEIVYVNQGERYYVFEFHGSWCEGDEEDCRVYYYDDEVMEYYYDWRVEEKRV